MNTIKIKNIQYGTIEVFIGGGCVSIFQSNNVTKMVNSEALTLAREILANCGEWISAEVKPAKTGLYHVKGGGWLYGFYYPHGDKWCDLDEKTEIGITHYQPIIQPKP